MYFIQFTTTKPAEKIGDAITQLHVHQTEGSGQLSTSEPDDAEADDTEKQSDITLQSPADRNAESDQNSSDESSCTEDNNGTDIEVNEGGMCI